MIMACTMLCWLNGITSQLDNPGLCVQNYHILMLKQIKDLHDVIHFAGVHDLSLHCEYVWSGGLIWLQSISMRMIDNLKCLLQNVRYFVFWVNDLSQHCGSWWPGAVLSWFQDISLMSIIICKFHLQNVIQFVSGQLFKSELLINATEKAKSWVA